MKKILLLISLISMISSNSFAVDVLSKMDDDNLPTLNENLGTLDRNVKKSADFIDDSFNSNILITSRGGTGQDSSAWTSGDVVYLSSTGVWGHTPITTINPHGFQDFLSSGTFVAPTGVTTVYVTMCGAGGGGKTSPGGGNGGGGGGAGECIIKRPYTVVAGNSYTVTINAGGTTGTGGGTTVFDTLTVLGGLSGGASLTGGIGTGTFDASSNLPGFKGGDGAAGNLGGGNGGRGGGTIFGTGAVGGSGASGTCPGNAGSDAASNTGAGGGGGGCNVGTGAVGGSGRAIIEW